MPVTAASRTSRRLAGPLLTGGVVLAGVVALHVRDPHVQGSWGSCPFAALTGWDCPGCGTLRAVNLMGNGDLVGAASSNLVFTLLTPVLLVAWALWLRAAWTGAPFQMPRRLRSLPPWVVAASAGVVMLGFALLRNLPAGAWLHS